MRFQPKTKDELEAMNLVKPGIYKFTVLDAEDKKSKSGNEMIQLKLEVFDESGSPRHVFAFLLEAMANRLYEFCESTSMVNHYDNGTLRAVDCIGKSAWLELTIEKGKDNPQGGTYPDRNGVKKYMTKENAQAAIIKAKGSQTSEKERIQTLVDDDLPF